MIAPLPLHSLLSIDHVCVYVGRGDGGSVGECFHSPYNPLTPSDIAPTLSPLLFFYRRTSWVARMYTSKHLAIPLLVVSFWNAPSPGLFTNWCESNEAVLWVVCFQRGCRSGVACFSVILVLFTGKLHDFPDILVLFTSKWLIITPPLMSTPATHQHPRPAPHSFDGGVVKVCGGLDPVLPGRTTKH